MNAVALSNSLLQLRLALTRRGLPALAGVALCVIGAVALAWYLPQLRGQRELDARAIAPTVILAPLTAPPPTADQNLIAFYDNLGDRHDVEEQVKTIFALAAKSGLVLASGQYKTSYDPNSAVHSYQVSLPVRGDYRAVWQFALQVLATIPFASLDEIGFKREAITDASVEAHLRFTLYLKKGAARP